MFERYEPYPHTKTTTRHFKKLAPKYQIADTARNSAIMYPLGQTLLKLKEKVFIVELNSFNVDV